MEESPIEEMNGIMKFMKEKSNEFKQLSTWRPILQNLATERVTVMLDGVTILAEIEAHFFDYGSLLTPPSNKLSDATVYKAECDACFYPPNKQDRTPSVDGKATLVSTIWKDGRLVGCKVCKGLSCNSSEHAEGLALVYALIHGSELEIKKLDVITDNDTNYEIMKRKIDVRKHTSPETSMAFIQAAKEYEVCKCRREPREMISHVNDIAKATHLSRVDFLESTQILELKSAHFWGMAIILIKQNQNDTRGLIGASENDLPSFGTRSYYVNVQNERGRSDAFEGLVQSLNPYFLIVFVSDASMSQVVLKRLSLILCYSCNCNCLNLMRSAYVLVNHRDVIPPFSASKCLMVVYDNAPNSIEYNKGQDSIGVMAVDIVGPRSKPHLLPHSAKEVDPFLFGFFNYHDQDSPLQDEKAIERMHDA
ncbi:hypothetical protein ABZP36_023836 [Zizania latifolia]